MISFQGFREALKKAKLPSTIPTIKKWEKQGVISYPANPLEHRERKDRLYTPEEVKENIRKIKEHKKALKKKTS